MDVGCLQLLVFGRKLILHTEYWPILVTLF